MSPSGSSGAHSSRISAAFCGEKVPSLMLSSTRSRVSRCCCSPADRCIAWTALTEGAYAEAQQRLQESAAVYLEMRQRDELCSTIALLGIAARGLGNLRQAGQHLYVTVRTATGIGVFLPLVIALPAIALFLADQGEKERAVELYALASRYPYVANSCWFEDVVGRHIAAAATTLPPEIVAAAQERGRARDLDATVAELLEELGE